MGGIWVVGGTFDEQGGKPSYIVGQLGEALGATTVNGGHLDVLRLFSAEVPEQLVWMPNVANDEEKLLPRLKTANPKLLLVSSKRVVEKDYTEADVVGRLLKSKSNLGIMISKDAEGYRFRVLDPLGNLWCDTRSIAALAVALKLRMNALAEVTRAESVRVGDAVAGEIPEDFLGVIRDFGHEFTKYVNAINPNRFLGNAATRCSFGFPGIRWEGDSIFVTRRNVDKEGLRAEDFVGVRRVVNDGPEQVAYYGDAKPSVDTPIQLRLFEFYREVRYILHGHVYVEDEPFTEHVLPCGSIEEYDEIVNLHSHTGAANFAINLSGHGFLALACELDYLRGLKERLIARPFPERQFKPPVPSPLPPPA